MKKAINLIATVLIVCIVTVILNFLLEGVPLFNTPNTEKVEKVFVQHQDYPDEIKEFTDDENIELAVALLGYLWYSPFKSLSDDNRLIQITYIMDDNTEYVVYANSYTVWWNGKPKALHDENTFVKMCTAVFFPEK